MRPRRPGSRVLAELRLAQRNGLRRDPTPLIKQAPTAGAIGVFFFRSLAMTSLCRKQCLRSLRDACAHSLPHLRCRRDHMNRAPLGHGGKVSVTHPKKQNPGHTVTGVFFFRSPAPLRANALDPAARRARVVRLGTKPNCWLCLLRAHPTLSWGTPCERTHHPVNEKGPH